LSCATAKFAEKAASPMTAVQVKVFSDM
jgi:hypothetical protein